VTLRVTDHALVRMLERGGRLDVEALRAELTSSLERAVAAARLMGATRVHIHADGLVYVVEDDTLVTVLAPGMAHGGRR
jgi:hypothetical protein